MTRRTPQDRFSNRMADIERDYERQVARGMDPVVARAKRRQRVADARDDLAIRSGGDRSQTRADERAAESALTSVRRATRAMAALPTHNVAAPIPRIVSESAAPAAVSSADIAAATTPGAGARSLDPLDFGAAFRAARAEPNRQPTFRWRGREYTTQTREEAPRRNTNSNSSSGRPRANDTSRPAAAPAANPPAAVSRRSGLTGSEYTAALRAGVIPGNASAEDRANLRATIAAQRDAARGRSAAKGGSVKKMAKGGSVKKSIDGIAKRGKTRLSTRKK